MDRLHSTVKYLVKWVPIAVAIGIVSGLGAGAFIVAIRFCVRIFLTGIAGYLPPVPLGTGPTLITPILHRWFIPVATTLGGLISGFIVFRWAPEAEGHGTDAAIDAFHNKEGRIRARVPLIKMAASAVTLGSGGSAGREGPTAQIAAGFGSVLGTLLGLNAHDRRIALATGIGAGIGAIFKAPFGGAILSAEILYLHGMELDALAPSLMASTVGYVVFTHFFGYTPVFGWHLAGSTSFNPATLPYYALLGVLCGLVGILYARMFYMARDLFHKVPGPKLLRPVIGGFIVGLIGIYLPEVLSVGYGWIQVVMENFRMLPLALIIVLIFGKIIATSVCIGSGESGGVFAPGLFIGSMIGAALWGLLRLAGAPNLPAGPELFMAVGMVALFGGTARVPLAMILMIAEMTGSYALLIPAMLAVGLAYVVVGDNNTIYRSQLANPAASPAHAREYLAEIVKCGEINGFDIRELMGPELEYSPSQDGRIKAVVGD
ncbi:MAG: chloride channel protein [Peptococcaceae bacterium]|jgi:CIC family chloride channel protein|nr:chloride channel protein [Peptococcaceae bacterium]